MERTNEISIREKKKEMSKRKRKYSASIQKSKNGLNEYNYESYSTGKPLLEENNICFDDFNLMKLDKNEVDSICSTSTRLTIQSKPIAKLLRMKEDADSDDEKTIESGKNVEYENENKVSLKRRSSSILSILESKVLMQRKTADLLN